MLLHKEALPFRLDAWFKGAKCFVQAFRRGMVVHFSVITVMKKQMPKGSALWHLFLRDALCTCATRGVLFIFLQWFALLFAWRFAMGA